MSVTILANGCLVPLCAGETTTFRTGGCVRIHILLISSLRARARINQRVFIESCAESIASCCCDAIGDEVEIQVDLLVHDGNKLSTEELRAADRAAETGETESSASQVQKKRAAEKCSRGALCLTNCCAQLAQLLSMFADDNRFLRGVLRQGAKESLDNNAPTVLFKKINPQLVLHRMGALASGPPPISSNRKNNPRAGATNALFSLAATRARDWRKCAVSFSTVMRFFQRGQPVFKWNKLEGESQTIISLKKM